MPSLRGVNMWLDTFKKKIAIKPKTVPVGASIIVSNVHPDFVFTKAVTTEKDLLVKFKTENDLTKLVFRKGAAFTAPFGLADGWGSKFSPGYVRVHPGVDRAGGGSIIHNDITINDIVICPLNFDESDYLYYGPTTSYGTLSIFINRKYGFDLRIGHMNPVKNFIPWSLQQLKSHKPFGQGWILGSAGTYGYSTGAHTHTELISLNDDCDVFEQMLTEKFGEDVNKEYTDEYIISEYKRQATAYPATSPYVNWTNDQIRRDWISLKKAKNVVFINKYKYIFYWTDGKHHTRYATNMVFEGL
jgi:hypothetical protein